MVRHQVRDTLDTNLIVHLILGEPEEQSRKVWDLLSDDGNTHYVPDLAITETEYVLTAHYGWSRKAVVVALRNFFARFDKVVDYNRELFELVFPCYLEHPKLSFNDCCMAFYAELGNAEPLFTFDKTLARQHPSAKLL